MGSSASWQTQVAEALGPISEVHALGGRAWGVVTGGRQVVAKHGPGVDDEAAGLDALAAVPGGLRVPEVILRRPGLLVTACVDPAPASPRHQADLGERLARMHAAPWPVWGGGSSWIGDCPVEPAESSGAAAFYGSRLTGLARRCGLEGPVGRVVARLEELIPPSAPALLHGDLWWGNVLWAAHGQVFVIDPSVHGGHPEEDLAMLALFGPVPGSLYGSYAAVRDLDAGWRGRVELWQLYPVLVHAVLFGGSYRAQAAAIAGRFG